MAQATTNMAASPAVSTNTTASANGSNGKGKREAKTPSATDAITKIIKILKQLTPLDRKRVLGFVNCEVFEGADESTSSAE